MGDNGFDEQQALELEREGQAWSSITLPAVAEWDAEVCNFAARLMDDSNRFLRSVQDCFEPETKRRFEAHKQLTTWRKRVEGPASLLQARIKTDTAAFLRLERDRAEAERQRLQAQADEDARQATLAAAIEAEELGMDDESIEMVLSTPVQAEIVRAPEISRVAGVTTREDWKARVVDLPALLHYLADHKELRPLAVETKIIAVVQASLNKLASVHQRELNIPGVEAYPDVRGVKTGR